MKKDCNNCKHEKLGSQEEPCKTCVDTWPLWEPIIEPTCKWELVFDGDGEDWQTECGMNFRFVKGISKENFEFCPYCGRKSVVEELE